MESQTITGQKTRRGFNLIESAIVLGVVGLIIGGIWVAAASFYESYKVNKTVEGVLTIARNVQSLISIRDAIQIPNDSYINATLISSNAIPKLFVYGNKAEHPFSGSIYIRSYNLNADNPDHPIARFQIYLDSLSSDICSNIVVRISSIASSANGRYNPTDYESLITRNGLSRIVINNSIFGSFPVSFNVAKAACSSNSNQVRFVFPYTRIN